MDKISNITYGVVCLVVIVILIATICIPVIEDAQKEQITTGQNTTQRFSMNDDNEDVVIIDTGAGITVNGTTVTTDFGCLAFSDDLYVYYTGTVIVIVAATSIFEVSSINVSAGVLSYVKSDTTEGSINLTSPLLYYDPNGSYGQFITSSVFYVNEDSKMYAIIDYTLASNSDLDPSSIGFRSVVNGTIKDMTDSHMLGNASLTGSLVVNMNYTEELGCYKVTASGSTGIYTNSDGSYVANTLSLYVVAPLEYTYLTENGSMIYQLLNILPLILLIIPVMLAVNMITRRD